jgi:hypothetical protein
MLCYCYSPKQNRWELNQHNNEVNFIKVYHSYDYSAFL